MKVLLRLGFPGAKIRASGARMLADVVFDFGQREGAIDGVGGGWREGQIAGRRIGEVTLEAASEVVAQFGLAAFHADFAVDEIVCDVGLSRAAADANAAVPIALRPPN